MLRRLALALALACTLAFVTTPTTGCRSRAEAPSAEEVAKARAVLAWPESVEAAEAARASSASYTNRDIRILYVARVAEIAAENEGWKAEGLGPAERARKAFGVRHEARKIARALMRDQAEVEALRVRDREQYGDPDGPTFESLLEKNRGKGLAEDEAYEAIIESAQRTNAAVNESMGL